MEFRRSPELMSSNVVIQIGASQLTIYMYEIIILNR